MSQTATQTKQVAGREVVEQLIRQQHLSTIGPNQDMFYSSRDTCQQKAPIVELVDNKPSFSYMGRDASDLLKMESLRQQFDERGILYDEDFGNTVTNYVEGVRRQAVLLGKIADRIDDRIERGQQ
ncbi:MAG: hypothetical protein ABH864_06265 [archaeon]